MQSTQDWVPDKLGWAGIGMILSFSGGISLYISSAVLAIWGNQASVTILQQAGNLSWGGFLYSLGWFTRDRVLR